MVNRTICRYVSAAFLFQVMLPLFLALPGSGFCDAAQRHLPGMSAHAGHHHSLDQASACLCALKQAAKLVDTDAAPDAVSAMVFVVQGAILPVHAEDIDAAPCSCQRARAPPAFLAG